MNELKVFVDLASISAGENDMDVDRVACFHDTVHGYSSLLYELRQESGFEDFMRCLKKLWRALDSDENLPKKLVSSAGAGALPPLVLLLSRSGWKIECKGQIALVWGHHRSSCYCKKSSSVSVAQKFTAAAVAGTAQVAAEYCWCFRV